MSISDEIKDKFEISNHTEHDEILLNYLPLPVSHMIPSVQLYAVKHYKLT